MIRQNFLFFLVLIPFLTYSQGSGDAGLQSSGDFDARSRATDTPSRIYILQKAGMGTNDVICLTSEFQMDWNVWGGINIWFAVPYQFMTGKLATVHGVGDLRVILSHTLAEAGDFTVKLNFGAVIPSGNSNVEKEGKALPMIYQNSQGCPSFMASAMFYYRGWNLYAGYQRTISGNKNNFSKALWGEVDDVKDYPDSPGLWPGDDLVFRIKKDFDRPKAQYTISMLPAYRLNADQTLHNGDLQPVEGTIGFSLNVSAGVEVMLGKYGYFHFLAAAPVLERDAYPDGLDRVFTVMAGFGVQFPE